MSRLDNKSKEGEFIEGINFRGNQFSWEFIFAVIAVHLRDISKLLSGAGADKGPEGRGVTARPGSNKIARPERNLPWNNLF